MRPWLLVALLLVAGCAPVFTRPDTSELDLRRDRYQCELETANTVPRSGMGGLVGLIEAGAMRDRMLECMALRGYTRG